jgi:cytochrome bd-type quinol oxidase subunit 2
MGWLNKKPFAQRDYKLATWLMILTHTQLILGLTLYFVSPWVNFTDGAMQDRAVRYWTAEHITAMIIAVALITMARIFARKATVDVRKYQNLFWFNGIALLIIVVTILLSGRGLLGASFLRNY